MSGHKWEDSNPHGALCRLCSVAAGTIYATQPCPAATRETHAEELQAARDWVGEAEAWMFDALDISDEKISAIGQLIDAKVELALLERG